MTDPLHNALRNAPPPDPAAKATALALAMKNFDALQDIPAPMRPITDRRKPAGPFDGVRRMFTALTSRRGLAATTSVAALCLAVIIVPQALKAPAPRSEPKPESALLETGNAAVQSTAPQTALTQALPETAEDEAALFEVAPAELAQAEPAVEPLMAPESPSPAPLARKSLSGSVQRGIVAEPALLPPPDTETFASLTPNPVKVTAEEPVSTFSVDVDTASYSYLRAALNAGSLPDPDAVRVEEMINYFPYAYPAPEPGAAPFTTTVTVLPTPWNPGTNLVHIALQGRLPAIADRPPLNLVFLIDTSGSMEEPNKLPLLIQSLKLMLPELRAEDEVAIVAYAGSAGEVLAPTPASDRPAISAALERLSAGGATAGAEGLELAYQTAAKMTGAGEVSRILLATDGDFNVGLSDPEALKTFIAKERDLGIYLSVLGFGRGNLDDATMQALAQNGNGTAAYIDTLQEARKVLVDQLTGALFPIANDVKLQIEWNPALVAEYRLIGYETRALNREDFTNDRVDAGEIGAGHRVTALYEVTAPGSPALRNVPLRYGQLPEATPPEPKPELGFLRLRYKAPGETASALIETPILPASGTPNADTRFATAIAGFGQLLTGATYLGDWGWDQVIALAEGARGDDPFGYRIEAVNLMRLAQSLSR